MSYELTTVRVERKRYELTGYRSNSRINIITHVFLATCSRMCLQHLLCGYMYIKWWPNQR